MRRILRPNNGDSETLAVPGRHALAWQRRKLVPFSSDFLFIGIRSGIVEAERAPVLRNDNGI
jgi:hypothetical protein